MKNKRKVVISFIAFILIMLINLNVFATELTDLIGTIEYTEEYKHWLELSEEEREGLIEPRMFNISKEDVEITNPLKRARMLKSTLESKYSLQENIPENIIIKNQGNTNSCWTFGALTSLETNLALKNYYNGNSAKVYDFSERHMEYATSRKFLNGETNPIGFNREINSGGNFYLYNAYLTNGTGAINEDDMPFQNEANLINLSEIQNKEVVTQVYDIEEFPTYKSTEDLTQIKQQMKEHIKNCGAIEVGIYGANLFSENCYNNKTGAIYCDNSSTYPIDHSVAIIGWDDNYDKNNFNEKLRPKNNGAWIIKNSWGTEVKITYDEIKESLFEMDNKHEKYNSVNDVKDKDVEDFIEEQQIIDGKEYVIGDREIIRKIGDNGIMYVSYEDANIYSQMTGISLASDTVNYDNIYQYNEYGYSIYLPFNLNKIYLGNIFNKNTTQIEDLTEVSISTLEKVTCRVYVNPNGESKNKEDLQLVQLKAGESETFGAGYHTLEFLEPIRIKGDSFVVVIEMQSSGNEIKVPLEAKIEEPIYKYVEIENNKCYCTTEEGYNNNTWENLSTLSYINEALPNCDSTIKAFTVEGVEDNSLKNIEIVTPANKLEYKEGENFDKTGMVVKANYNNGESKIIENYDIEDGTNLKVTQTFVTISYEGKTVQQNITVTKEGIENPQNSNFNNVICKVKGITTNSLDNYMLLEIELSNIEKSKINDKLEYYYWLSPNQKETNIDKWIKINGGEIVDGKLTFTINSKDIPNYQEVSMSDVLYLYVKEKATKGEIEKEFITDSIKVEFTDDSANDTSIDNTVSKKVLPNAGVQVIVITILSIIFVFAIIKLIKYRDLKDIK